MGTDTNRRPRERVDDGHDAAGFEDRPESLVRQKKLIGTVSMGSGERVAVEALRLASDEWPLFGGLRLKILRNRSAVEFIIGDAPAVLHNQWCRKVDAVGTLGLICAGLQCFLPLSPEFIAVLYDIDIY